MMKGRAKADKGNEVSLLSLPSPTWPPCQRLHASALRSHDQPAAGDAAENDTPFWRQCSMSSYPTKTTLLTVTHARVCVCVCTFHDIISQRCHYPTPFHPVQAHDQINTIRTPSQSTHTRRDARPCFCNWNKTPCEQKVMTWWFWWCVIYPARSQRVTVSLSLSLTFPPTIIHLFTSFHMRLVIDAYLASNENISVCVWVDCCWTCHEP